MKNSHAKHERSKRLLQGGSAALLTSAGLRPTRPRLALADWLFRKPNKHVTAEQAHAAMTKAGVSLSLATVYNTLNLLAGAGLLRQICVDGKQVLFDTNRDPHHYMYNEASGRLTDIPPLRLVAPPRPPRGMKITDVEIVIRVR
ncbi:MAG: transcriptional repressor [Alphaproteobacteria bacterium]|nr:transcriptional repressor [Alphaproteobacteria bacterium]